MCSKLNCNYSVIQSDSQLRDEKNYLQGLITDNVSVTFKNLVYGIEFMGFMQFIIIQ
jgi:hypothetical protein